MATADWSRRVESGGAYGYYDPYPNGTFDLPLVGSVTADFVSGLHNSWWVKKTVAAGTTVQVFFGQNSSNPTVVPIPKLFDVNISLSGSITASFVGYDVDLASLLLTATTLTITIGTETKTYSQSNLGDLSADLVNLVNVPKDVADSLASVVDDAMDDIQLVEDGVLEFYKSLTTAALSGLDHAVHVALDTSTATSSDNGTPVNIGEAVNVIGTSYNDTITGSNVANHLEGGAGNDLIDGGANTNPANGTDELVGGSGNDTLTAGADGGNLIGGSGNDVLSALGSTGQSVLLGGSGNDTLTGNGQSILSGALAMTSFISRRAILSSIQRAETASGSMVRRYSPFRTSPTTPRIFCMGMKAMAA